MGTTDTPDFAPEPYSTLYQRSMYQSMRNVTGKVFRLLKAKTPGLPEPLRAEAQELMASHDQVVQVFEAFLRQRVGAVRVRFTGTFTLGNSCTPAKTS